MMMELPPPGTPLVDRQGRVFSPSGALPKSLAELATQEQAVQPAPPPVLDPPTLQHRLLDELPVKGDRLRAALCVLGLSILRIRPREIAEAFGLTEEQVNTLLAEDDVGELRKVFVSSIDEADTDLIRRQLRASAGEAVSVLRRNLTAKDAKVAQKAADSVLDRNGYVGKSSDDIRNAMMGGLRITVINKNESTDVNIDLGKL